MTNNCLPRLQSLSAIPQIRTYRNSNSLLIGAYQLSTRRGYGIVCARVSCSRIASISSIRLRYPSSKFTKQNLNFRLEPKSRQLGHLLRRALSFHKKSLK
jgi:hypothetical protein